MTCGRQDGGWKRARDRAHGAPRVPHLARGAWPRAAAAVSGPDGRGAIVRSSARTRIEPYLLRSVSCLTPRMSCRQRNCEDDIEGTAILTTSSLRSVIWGWTFPRIWRSQAEPWNW